MEETGQDGWRERQGEGDVPERHVAAGCFFTVRQYVAGERPIDAVVGAVADAVPDAEDIEEAERADQADRPTRAGWSAVRESA